MFNIQWCKLPVVPYFTIFGGYPRHILNFQKAKSETSCTSIKTVQFGVLCSIFSQAYVVPSIEAAEEDTLVDPIDPVMHVAVAGEVEVDEGVTLGVFLGQSLGPEPGLAREVRTRVLGEGLDCQRVLENNNIDTTRHKYFRLQMS